LAVLAHLRAALGDVHGGHAAEIEPADRELEVRVRPDLHAEHAHIPVARLLDALGLHQEMLDVAQGHFFSARRIFSGVNGMAVTRALSGISASLIAFMTAPGAPAVPASPTPLAPSCDCMVGVSTWAQMMSGISPLIGTR